MTIDIEKYLKRFRHKLHEKGFDDSQAVDDFINQVGDLYFITVKYDHINHKIISADKNHEMYKKLIVHKYMKFIIH